MVRVIISLPGTAAYGGVRTAADGQHEDQRQRLVFLHRKMAGQ